MHAHGAGMNKTIIKTEPIHPTGVFAVRKSILYSLAAFLGMVLLALPLMAEITFAEERQVALWILRRGGQVMVEAVANPIGDPFDLPDRDFRIVMVDMHGTVIEPKQLQEINKLEHVRELYVPGRVWSP